MSQNAPRNRGATTYSSVSPIGSPITSTGTTFPPGLARKPSGQAASLLPNPASYGNKSSSIFSARNWYKFKRLLTRPLTWVVIILLVLITWYSSGARRELDKPEVQRRLREIFPPEVTADMQFYPASNNKIHYVGRWTAAPNRLRFDGAFPGVYFELNVTNTSSLFLSLQNARPEPTKLPRDTEDEEEHLQPGEVPGQPGGAQYHFGAGAKQRAAAKPISLLALVDGEEYVILPNATSLVTVRMKDMNPRQPHTIRIIAPMTDNDGKGMIQFDGLWIDKGGALQPLEGTIAHARSDDDDDDFTAESDDVGKKHRLGLSKLLNRYNKDQIHKDDDEESGDDPVDTYKGRRKMLEVITDMPAHLNKRAKAMRAAGSDSLLAGVMGWEYLLGEMFSVDHASVAVEGICLIHDCVGGTGSPNGMGDVFFRSGPADTPHYSHPWPFQSYVPDVIVIQLGASDMWSFDKQRAKYTKTPHELWRSFEDTYVSFVRAIRTLAYTQHPSVLEAERLGIDAEVEDNSPANIPIFIMRPFNGELEHATQGAVNRLRDDGDKAVFWLDTTGWLETEDTERTASDFFTDPEEESGRPHLTERGNQKAAIYLHMHVCRFLAANPSECAFLPPEVYQGSIYDPEVTTFDRYIENEKQRQIKELFWDETRQL